jgi:hypothetical protein
MPSKQQFKFDPQMVSLLYSELGNATEVGRRLGTCAATVIRISKAAGYQHPSKYMSEHDKQEIVRLYVGEQLSGPEVARKIGVYASSVLRYLTKIGKNRDTSIAHALSARNKSGRRGKAAWWQSEKTGQWESADSRFEIVRMYQLDKDENVVMWTRQTPIIQYAGNKRYVPDFLITLKDGTQILEEVKPHNHVNKELVLSGKMEAAQKYCCKNGMKFRVVTEKEIGVSTIRTFKYEGLQAITEVERLEKRKEKDAAYQLKNKDLTAQRHKIWYAENKEKIRARQRGAYHQKMAILREAA